MNRDVGGPRPPVGRARAAAVGLVLVAAVSPQLGAAFAVTLFDELGPAGAAFLRLAIAAIIARFTCLVVSLVFMIGSVS